MGVRCEIWDRANARRRAIVHSITAAEHTAAIGRDETLSLEGSASDAAWGSLSRASVLRLQTEGEAADFSLWRVTRSGLSRGPGALTRKISAQALWMDLRHGRVNQPQADGSVLFVFGLIGLTPTEWLSNIILPGYAGDALTFELGVVERGDPIDLTFEQPTTPLEALRMLEQASGGEVQFRYSADGSSCSVDLLERVGGPQGGARLRYGHNITGLERYEDDTDSISRIYAVGSGTLSLADATWPITAVGGVAGARVLSFTKSPVFEDGAFVGGYLSIGGVTYLITASDVAGGTITVDEGAHAVPAAGDVALLCSDAAGSRLAYLESPSARAEVGVRTGELADASDVPDACNLVANSDYASWAAGIPVSWSTLGAPTLTQVTDPLYARHGSTAVQVDAAAADEGLISDAFAIPTGDSRRPYLGISAALTALSGEVRLELRHSNGEVYPLQERPGPTGTGVYDVVRAGPVDDEPLPAGTGRVALISHGGAASFVADAVMATPQLAAEVPGYVHDQGAWVLWDRAVDDLRLRMVQAREYSVDVVDLYRVDPARFAFHELRLGDDCQVWDPDFGGAETLRIVELTTDVLHPEGARVSVAPGPWQRPIRSDADLFRPRYTQRRPSFASTAPRPRASLLDVSQQWDDSAGELYVTALGNSATATLELRTKSSRDVAYPAAASQTEAGRSATFGAAVSRTESLYWKVTAKDGRGVAGEAREGSITNGQLSLQGQSEAAAMRQDLHRLQAELQDRQKQYTSVSTNPVLDPESVAATNLAAAWEDYQAKRTALVNAIDAAVADDYVDDDDRAAYDTASTAYSAAVGVFSQRLQEAVDAIRAAGDAVVQAAAQQAIDDAAGAQAAADGKVTTFFSSTAPTAEGVGDLWLDDTKKLHRWGGAAWVDVQDEGIGAAIADAATAQATADGKITSYYQSEPPTEASEGDYWTDSDDQNALYRWSEAQDAWIDVRDGSVVRILAPTATLRRTGTGLASVILEVAGALGEHGRGPLQWQTVEIVGDATTEFAWPATWQVTALPASVSVAQAPKAGKTLWARVQDADGRASQPVSWHVDPILGAIDASSGHVIPTVPFHGWTRTPTDTDTDARAGATAEGRFTTLAGGGYFDAATGRIVGLYRPGSGAVLTGDAVVQGGDNISRLTNDAGYATSQEVFPQPTGATGAYRPLIRDSTDSGSIWAPYGLPSGAPGSSGKVLYSTGAASADWYALSAADVGALPTSYVPPVTSVNGKTGAVTLVASDVGAAAASHTHALDGSSITGILPASKGGLGLDLPTSYPNVDRLFYWDGVRGVMTPVPEGTAQDGYVLTRQSGAPVWAYGGIPSVPSNNNRFMQARVGQIGGDQWIESLWALPYQQAQNAASVLMIDQTGDSYWSASYVSSVNGKTGVASLSASDVGALSNNGGTLDGSLAITQLLNGGVGAWTTSGIADWNDPTNSKSGQGYKLLLGTDANGPSPGGYFHAWNFEYQNRDGTGNTTQFAIPYGISPADGVWYRGSYGGVWSGWYRLVDSVYGDGRYARGGGYTVGQSLLTSSDVLFHTVNTSDWFQSTVNGTGLYNTANTYYWYSDSNRGRWISRSESGIEMQDTAGTVRGFLYFNADGVAPDGFGLLGQSGGWAVRCDPAGGGQLYGSWTAGNLYASRYYDSTNTGYYLQPAGTSSLYSAIYGNSFHVGTGGDGSVGLSTGSATQVGYIEWLLPSGVRQGYMGWNNEALTLQLENGYLYQVLGGNMTVSGSVTAAAFADQSGYPIAHTWMGPAADAPAVGSTTTAPEGTQFIVIS